MEKVGQQITSHFEDLAKYVDELSQLIDHCTTYGDNIKDKAQYDRVKEIDSSVNAKKDAIDDLEKAIRDIRREWN